jgi:hypothetical protein
MVDSAKPQIVLKYHDGSYHLATDLMKKPPPNAKELSERITVVRQAMHTSENTPALRNRQWADGGVPSSMWVYMLDLIYSGNGELALKFFDTVWPNSKQGKRAFLEDFQKVLTESPYWPEIKTFNGWQDRLPLEVQAEQLVSQEPPARNYPVAEPTPRQKEACQTILRDAERLMDRVETVRGGIPYNYYVDRAWWNSKSLHDKESLITAISTCKGAIYGERVIHIYDSGSGEELGRMSFTGPTVYK